MKKISVFALALAVLAASAASLLPAQAAVTASATTLVADPLLVKASSAPTGIFALTLSQDAGETLSSVSVLVNDNGASGVATSSLASLALYKDNGDGNFDAATDMLSGTQTSVSIGATSTISTTANNTINGGKFFVAVSTSASWSDASVADSITVTLPANAITTSSNSPSISALTTAAITADTTNPSLVSATAKNTGGTSAKEAGDTIEFVFSEATNKPAINSSNINSVLALNNSHSFLDSLGSLGGASWDVAGTVLTVTLSASSTASSTVASVEVGDAVTVTGSIIKDLAGNSAAGNRIIAGSFSGSTSDDDDDDNTPGTRCGNTLINGRLYKVKGEDTVYLAAACRLKPFRGAAVFRARGHKFMNIIELDSLSNVTVSQRPVLPVGGTLVKGSGPTVWFVTDQQLRRAFRTAAKFHALGFQFNQVMNISDQDLSLIPEGSVVEDNETHPSGSIIKCSNTPTVFQVMGNLKVPFASADAFQNRGHSWNSIAVVSCSVFKYLNGAKIE